jgi:hypothetical protein
MPEKMKILMNAQKMRNKMQGRRMEEVKEWNRNQEKEICCDHGRHNRKVVNEI